MSPQHICSPMPCPHAQLSSHRGGWQRGLEPSLSHTPLLGLRHMLSRGRAAELHGYVTLSPGQGSPRQRDENDTGHSQRAWWAAGGGQGKMCVGANEQDCS